jgi:hypothetical protein
MNARTKLDKSIAHQAVEQLPVRWRPEDVLAVIAPQCHVIETAGDVQPKLAGHRAFLVGTI